MNFDYEKNYGSANCADSFSLWNKTQKTHVGKSQFLNKKQIDKNFREDWYHSKAALYNKPVQKTSTPVSTTVSQQNQFNETPAAAKH